MISKASPLPERRRSLAAARALELRLLDQIAILMGDQVALDLADRVHRHVDHDQQAGSAEVEGHAGLAERNIRDQADGRQIGRADYRDAVEEVVEIMLGCLARTDAGDEAAVALQILGRLFRIELYRGVEE